MASLTTTAPLFLGHWPIAILVSFTVLFTNPLFMLGGGGTRQIGTGITVAHVASAATVGLVLLVDHLRTDVSTAALAA
ncbi:hypothetical protein [Gordonia aurantiaca]|uniref:hypothetical protein n=1 Tax=Gordonia sp. B21 TaxID=3151852 RepID=UPI003262E2DB